MPVARLSGLLAVVFAFSVANGRENSTTCQLGGVYHKTFCAAQSVTGGSVQGAHAKDQTGRNKGANGPKSAVNITKSTDTTQPQSRPTYNVLFLICDSMDGRVLDPTSPISSYLEMPYMWNLAAQGVNFINAYANSPQCSPSRTSMFTGRYPHQTKAWSNAKSLAATPGSGTTSGVWDLDKMCVKSFDEALCAKWAQDQNVSATFIDTLVDANVHVALYGKMDLGGNIVDREDQEVHAPGGKGFHKCYLDTVGRAADIRKATSVLPLANTSVPSTKIHEEDWETLSGCLKWFEENSNRSSPWMLYCSLSNPHPPYECNEKTLANVSTNIPLPEWFASPAAFPETKMHPYDSYMSYSKGMMNEQNNFTKELLETNIRCWYAMCQQTDDMLGIVWEKAGETGNLGNTIIIMISDHGEMHMEHRQSFKNTFYEGSARVPFIIAPPATKPGVGTRDAFHSRGHIVNDLTSLLDVYPTLVDATGGSPHSFLEGESLLPYVMNQGRRKKDYVVGMYMSNYANTNAFMIRQGPWKYIAFGRYGADIYAAYNPQLFNLVEDPNELKDVSSENDSTVAALDALLRTVIDYDTVDREVKMEERMLYDRYYRNLNRSRWREEWESAYAGFDDADEARVDLWYRKVESSPQPDELDRVNTSYGSA